MPGRDDSVDEGMIADLESEVADLIGADGSNASDRDSCTASSSSGGDSPRYSRQSRHVLEWHVAEASLGTSRRSKRVLKSIKGRVETGSFTILVGPSGSGRTMLLDCLARRHRHFVGAVCLNGRELHAPSCQQVAVVRPVDYLWGYLTPREHLTFHALAAAVHRASLHKAVGELLGLMGLEGCGDVLVREMGKGERRRLHLATHLLANPAVLLLDDPTQGLDGPASSSLLHCLSSLAERGPPLLASLPLPLPPPPQAFYTHAILLTCDGRQAFYGSREELERYVCSYLRLPLSCPSPLDALVRLLGPQPHETEASADLRLGHLVRAFDDSPWAPTTPAPSADQGPSDLLPNVRRADWLTLLELNLARSFACVARNRATCLRWVGAMLTTGLVLGLAFRHVPPSDWRGVRWSLFLLTWASTLFASILQSQTLHIELPAIRKECRRGANAVGPYVLTKALVLTPFWLGGAGMAAVVYFGTGLGGKGDVSHVSCFVLLLGLHMAACSGLAALLASLLRRPMAALLLVWASFFLTSTATGLVPWQSLSLQWLHRLHPVDHTLCSLLGAQASGLAPTAREPLLALCGVKPVQVPRMMLELWSVGICLYVLIYMILRLQHASDTRT